MESTKSTVRVTTFKKWAFASDFYIETEGGIVASARCKYCTEVDYDKFLGEAKRRGLRGQVLKSLLSYRDYVSYIHHKTFSRHVGDSTSMHHWCKKTVSQESTSTTDQKRVDEMVIGSSFEYYKKLFTTALFIAEEELAFSKFKPLMCLLVDNGVKLGSIDKVNEIACAEMIDVLAEVVMEFVKNSFENAQFLTLSADASEARKTCEEKELVYGKAVVRGDFGYVPCTFLLKCQSLKEFGGSNGEGTYKAMLDAVESFIDKESFKRKLVCITTDGAAVNFGIKKGALVRMLEHVEWKPLTLHCFNHNLELAIKAIFANESCFKDIECILIQLFYLFKNSGKSWRMFRIVGETLDLKVLRYTKVSGTRFQAHIHRGLSNFLRNFLCFLLFAENVVELGMGKDAIVTNKMYPIFVGFRKKWGKYGTIAVANMFFNILIETSRLSLLMESDSVLMYQLFDAIRDANQNLNELINEKNEQLPANIEVISEDRDGDTMKIKVSASNTTLSKFSKAKDLAQDDHEGLEKKIKVVHDEFELIAVNSGRKKVENLQKKFIPVVRDSILERFQSVLEDEAYKAFKIFDTTEWCVDGDSEKSATLDATRIDVLVNRFETPLTYRTFDVKECKKEWKKIKRVINDKYKHLDDNQQMLWSRFLTNHCHQFPNISLIVEILLVLLASSAVVERGFSTVRRILGDTRLSLRNERLNSILMIKLNMPVLRKVIRDTNKTIIETSVRRYFGKKSWRWHIKKIPEEETSVERDLYGKPPKKMRKIDGLISIETDYEESDSNVGED